MMDLNFMDNNQTRHVLVLGGGGAKGSMQIEIMNELDKQGKLNSIDLSIGGSVGAINAALFALRTMSLQQIRDSYHKLLTKTFTKSFLGLPPVYQRKHFIECWMNLVGMKRMKDVNIPLMVSTIDMVTKESHYFKSWEDGSELILAVLLRSFAAPYYFGTLADDVTERVYGDGGMGLDNLPVTEAIFEVFSKGWATDNVKFIVIGTGFQNLVEDYDKMKHRSTIGQIMDYIQPYNGGFARMISRQKQIGQLIFLCKNFPQFHFDYYDIEIPKSLDKMYNVNGYNTYVEFGQEASKKPLISM
jgi:predicted acylesterase/phospholipase RssA